MSNQPATGRGGKLAVVAVAVGFLTALCCFQVRQGEVAVLSTFGRASRPYTTPGLYAKLPLPIQTVSRFDGRLQVLEAPLEQTFTADEQHLLVELFAAWKVTNPQVWLERVGSAENARQRLRGLLDTQRSAVLGRYAVADLVTTDAKRSRFEAAEAELLAAVKPAAEQDGISVELVGIRRLALPEVVTAQVLQRMTQERSRVASRLKAQGEEQADVIRSAAKVQAAKITAQARADAIGIQAEGERAAAQAYQAYRQKPDLAGFLAELHSLEGIAGDQQTTLVLPAEGPVLRLLKEQGLVLQGGH